MLIAAALVILASACGFDGAAPGSPLPASPTAVKSTSPAPAEQLITYLQQVRPLLRRAKAQDVLVRSTGLNERPDHSWTDSANTFHKVATAYDANSVEAATIIPPASLRKAHQKLIDAYRDWFALWSKTEEDLRLSVLTGSSDLPNRHSMYEKGAVRFGDWWFAVRVEARNLGIALPRNWRQLPRVISASAPSPVASGAPTSATSAPDPFVGKWSGTDNYGQGPFTMEIRKLGDGSYVQIGAAGQRTELRLRDGVLIGKVHLGSEGNVEGRVRVVSTSDGALKATITANAGTGLDGFDNIVTFKRTSD